MNARKIILLVTALALIAATAGWLTHLRNGQRLGVPGVRTLVVAGREVVALPADLPGYASVAVETPASVVEALPKDTCFGQRAYRAADGFQAQLNVVLMGADRSSIHQPQVCLPAQGWKINETEIATIPLAKPSPHELAAIKLTSSNHLTVEGQSLPASSLYVYWFVTDGELSADPKGLRRAWRSVLHLLRTGELQRWAYVSVFAVCEPGREVETFARMKQFIAAAVPEFQLAAGGAGKETRRR